MKLLFFTLLAVCLVAVCRSAEEEYDYEEEPSAPVTPAPAKPAAAGRLGGLLATRGRANVGKKGAAPAPSTTAKPVEQPVEQEEEAEEEVEEEQEEVPTTTTETPKNLVRGGVRPFRSNEDLLAALKRRRAQVPTTHSRDSHSTHAPVESATVKSNKASANRPKNTNESSGRSSSRGRFGSSRGSKPIQEEVEETQQEEVQVKPKPFRRG